MTFSNVRDILVVKTGCAVGRKLLASSGCRKSTIQRPKPPHNKELSKAKMPILLRLIILALEPELGAIVRVAVYFPLSHNKV